MATRNVTRKRMTKERFDGIKQAINDGISPARIRPYWEVSRTTFSYIQKCDTYDEYLELRRSYAPKPKNIFKDIVEQSNITIMQQPTNAEIMDAIQQLSEKLDRIKKVRW